MSWKDAYQAPDGHFWFCPACGKWNGNRVDVGDEACFLNAVLVEGTEPDIRIDFTNGARYLKNKVAKAAKEK